MESLLEKFEVSRMSSDEQALFLIEVGRILHERYSQKIEESRAKDDEEVGSFEQCALTTLNELIGLAEV